MKLILISVICLGFAACSTTKPTGAEIGPRISKDEYIKKMKAKTKSDKKYDGFYQLYEAHVTMVDSDVQSLVLQRKSDVFQWDDETAQKEREKMFQENSTETKFFLVMYTPKRKLMDLHRGNSMWKVYLEVNGQRYPAKIKKATGQLENISAVYPSLNRFSFPYEVQFSVPTSVAEESTAKFILTSALGTSEFVF